MISYFLWNSIDEQESMRWCYCFLVYQFELLIRNSVGKRILDLFRLCLVTHFENSELCGIQSNGTWNTRPRLCQQSHRYGDMSVFNNHMCQCIFVGMAVHIGSVCITDH